MPDWLTVLLAGLAALLAWLFRGKLFERTEKELTSQRDEARTHGQQQAIKAQATAQEAELLKAQGQKESKIHAADNSGISDELDNLFK